jgi:hypothetical protein
MKEPKAIQKATVRKGVESADDAIQLMIKHLEKPNPETIVYLREYGVYEDGRAFVTVTINYTQE